MQKIIIRTAEKKQVLDITKIVNDLLVKNAFNEGLVHLFVNHTTCSLTTADLDPGTDKDYLDAIEEIFSKLDFRHPHDPSHVGDHIMSSIIGPSITLTVQSANLVLGQYQRLVIIELAGPRERRINISFMTEKR